MASDHDSADIQSEASDEQQQIQPSPVQSNEQTLTLDGAVYPMNQLPQGAIDVLNDLIRCENEAAEPRYRLRQLAYAQQALTASLGQIIRDAGLEPLEKTTSGDNMVS
jgi:hypothetical protein